MKSLSAFVAITTCCFVLAACGPTGQDPEDTAAVPAAEQRGGVADSVGATQTASTEQAVQSYQQDGGDRADQVVAGPTQDDALARCRTLDTAQQSDCEMKVSQGFDADPAQSGFPPSTPTDATAAQDEDDDR